MSYLEDIRYVSFNQDATSLAIGTKNGAKIFSLNSLEKQLDPIYELKEDTVIIERLFSSSLIVLVSASAPRKLKVYHYKKNTEICSYNYANTILSIRLNRARLVVCLEDTIYIHSIKDMKVIHTIRDIASNPLGILALTTNFFIAQNALSNVNGGVLMPDNVLQNINTTTPQKATNTQADDSNVSSAVCNGPTYIAYPGSSTFGQIQIFDAINLRPITIIAAHENPLSALALDNTGGLVASASEKGTVIRVFSTTDGSRLYEFRRGVKRCVTVYCLHFSPLSEFLALTSNTETVHIFKLLNNEQNPDVLPLNSSTAINANKNILNTFSSTKQPTPSPLTTNLNRNQNQTLISVNNGNNVATNNGFSLFSTLSNKSSQYLSEGLGKALTHITQNYLPESINHAITLNQSRDWASAKLINTNGNNNNTLFFNPNTCCNNNNNSTIATTTNLSANNNVNLNTENSSSFLNPSAYLNLLTANPLITNLGFLNNNANANNVLGNGNGGINPSSILIRSVCALIDVLPTGNKNYNNIQNNNQMPNNNVKTATNVNSNKRYLVIATYTGTLYVFEYDTLTSGDCSFLKSYKFFSPPIPVGDITNTIQSTSNVLVSRPLQTNLTPVLTPEIVYSHNNRIRNNSSTDADNNLPFDINKINFENNKTG